MLVRVRGYKTLKSHKKDPFMINFFVLVCLIQFLSLVPNGAFTLQAGDGKIIRVSPGLSQEAEQEGHLR